MCNLFNNVSGVSVPLISKKLAIKTMHSNNILFLNDFHYTLPFLSINQNVNSIFIFSANKNNTHISDNFNFVQKFRKTHTGSI
jgi:hypothetical protein